MFNPNAKKPPKPVTRKVTVVKPADKPAANGIAHGRPKPVHANGASRSAQPKAARDAGGNAGRALVNNHLAVKRRSDSKTLSPSPSRSPSRKVSTAQKRKAPSPSATPDWGSSSSEEDVATSRKRKRPSPLHGVEESDDKRETLDQDALEWSQEKEDEYKIMHGYDLTLGKVKEYPKYMASKQSNEEIGLADLQYPSRCEQERFQLVIPNDNSDYNPVDDIINSVAEICKYYFPEEQAEFLTDEITGFPRKFRKARRELSGPNLINLLEEFNDFVSKALDDGTIPNHLRTLRTVPLPLVERILSQIYQRTVSPEVNLLKQYENGTDDVYGELLPRFCHQIFEDTNLRSGQVFVDLGSGVGNVVLQAALERGSESWGIERMANPSRLADKQLAEFVPRCKRWALKPGKATVIAGDFLLSPEVDEVLRRADVILVNNQAFLPKLNQDLCMKFLDLKDGCKIVSLRSFLPGNWEIKERNMGDPRNLIGTNERKQYFSDSVSWTDQGGDYFVATVDRRPLSKFINRLQRKEELRKKTEGARSSSDT